MDAYSNDHYPSLHVQNLRVQNGLNKWEESPYTIFPFWLYLKILFVWHSLPHSVRFESCIHITDLTNIQTDHWINPIWNTNRLSTYSSGKKPNKICRKNREEECKYWSDGHKNNDIAQHWILALGSFLWPLDLKRFPFKLVSLQFLALKCMSDAVYKY